MEHLMGEGPMGPTTLARRLGLSTPAVTAVLDRLTALGHANRTPHPTDRRAVVVVPSPASVGQAMATLTPMVNAIDRVLDEFTADEREVITAYLARVLDAYRANLPEGPGDDDGRDGPEAA
jgi:DNA-binding MarR family transcriptional regulator